MQDVILVAVVALPLIGLWLLVRGQQRRAQQVTLLAASLQVGQEVVTTSGLYGTIAVLDDVEATLLVAPDVQLRFDRRAIGRVLGQEDDTPGRG